MVLMGSYLYSLNDTGDIERLLTDAFAPLKVWLCCPGCMLSPVRSWQAMPDQQQQVSSCCCLRRSSTLKHKSSSAAQAVNAASMQSS